MDKYLVLAMNESDTPEGRGRMVHVMHTARDLKNAGVDVKVVFAGIGVTWLTEFNKMEHPFTKHYLPVWESIQDDIAGVCNFCSKGRFGAGEDTEALGLDFLGEDGSHFDISPFLQEGRQVITF